MGDDRCIVFVLNADDAKGIRGGRITLTQQLGIVRTPTFYYGWLITSYHTDFGSASKNDKIRPEHSSNVAYRLAALLLLGSDRTNLTLNTESSSCAIDHVPPLASSQRYRCHHLHVAIGFLKENPLGMLPFTALAELTTATKTSGDSFSMFSALNASGSVIAVIAMVNATEHNGPIAGTKLNPRYTEFWITSKIQTSYSYGVPAHVRFDCVVTQQSDNLQQMSTPKLSRITLARSMSPLNLTVVRFLIAGCPVLMFPTPKRLMSSSPTTVVWYRPLSRLRIFCGSTR